MPTTPPFVGVADEVWVISNYRTFFLDHTGYWRNLDQFIPMLLREFAAVGEARGLFTKEDREFLNRMHQRRDERLTWVKRLWHTLGFAVAVFIGFPAMAVPVWLPVLNLVVVRGLGFLVACTAFYAAGLAVIDHANGVAMRTCIRRRDEGPLRRIAERLVGTSVPPDDARRRARVVFFLSWLAMGGVFNKFVPVFYAYSEHRIPLPNVQYMFALWIVVAVIWFFLGVRIRRTRKSHTLAAVASGVPTVFCAFLASTRYGVELWQPYGLTITAACLAVCSALILHDRLVQCGWYRRGT